jgi:predicted dinucleotide-binding enzyme
MKIGIIGAGMIGATRARRLTAACPSTAARPTTLPAHSSRRGHSSNKPAQRMLDEIS